MIETIEISLDNIEIIRPLWEKNREYHEKSSQYFGETYKNISFDEKVLQFQSMNDKSIKISVAIQQNICLGYCISSINEGKAEILSLHVDQGHRGAGIGKNLVKEHLKWMKKHNCTTIGVTVSQENINTIGFYKKLGFFPNTLYMQQLF